MMKNANKLVNTGKHNLLFVWLFICVACLVSRTAIADYLPLEQQHLTVGDQPEVLWSQDFSNNADGLDELPALMFVENGYLSVSSPTSANTGALVQGTRSLIAAEGLLLSFDVTPKVSGASDVYIGARDTLLEHAHYALFRNGQIIASYYQGGWHEQELGSYQIDTLYKVELEFTADGGSLYIYPANLDRASGLQHDLQDSPWDDVRTAIEVYSGSSATATQLHVDNIQEINKPQRYLIKQDDSWISIAQLLYGSSFAADELAELMNQQPLYPGDALINPPGLIKEMNLGSRIPFAVDDVVTVDEDNSVVIPATLNDVVGMVAEVDELMELSSNGELLWMQDFSHDDSGLGILPEQMRTAVGKLVVVAPSHYITAEAFGLREYQLSDGVLFKGEITIQRDMSNSQIGFGLRDSYGHRHHYVSFHAGQIHAAYYQSGNQWDELGEFTLGTTYMVEFETSSSGTTFYIYEKGSVRTSGLQDTRNFSDWNSVNIYLLAEYWGDTEDDSLSITDVTTPQNGSAQITADGQSILYTPNDNFHGSNTFNYSVALIGGASDVGQVHVTINSVNDQPVANDDAIEIQHLNPVAIDVLVNDTDVDGDQLTIISTTQPASGTVSIDSGALGITYTPDATGSFSFDYTVSDGNGGEDAATVTVTIPDQDNDGVPDAIDECPDTPANQVPIQNGCSIEQLDRDGDGVPDVDDLFPDDPTEWADLDGDGTGDNSDPDIDGDEVLNEDDEFPADPTEWSDLDGDGVGDNSDPDRDGDDVNNEQDVFPDDPTASAHAAVGALTAEIQALQVSLSWQAPAVVDRLVGYYVYRADYGSTDYLRLNATAITGLSYVDTGVVNGQAYSYQVAAVADNATEGDRGQAVSVFIASNDTTVTDFSAVRSPFDAQLNWQSVSGVRYRIYRGPDAASLAVLTEVTTNSYLDTSASWMNAYVYRVDTLADFSNPISNQAVVLAGPTGPTASIAAIPALTIQLDNATVGADGVFEFGLQSANNVGVSGTYSNAVGPVELLAQSAADQISSTENDGDFRLTIAAVPGAQWSVTVSEPATPPRSATINFRFAADTTPPALSLDGPAQVTVSEDSFTVTGLASDAESGIDSITVQNDRFPATVFTAVQLEDNAFATELPLDVATNTITVTASDNGGNSSQATVVVEREIPAAPRLQILQPGNGDTVSATRIDVSGVLYTSLAPTDIRLIMNGEVQTPQAGTVAGIYPFSFEGVSLNPGLNHLLVRAETTAGNASASISVIQSEPDATQQDQPPIIQLVSPRADTFTNQSNFSIAGSVAAVTGPIILTINGQNVALFGNNDTTGTFSYLADLAGIEGEATFTLMATDGDGLTTEQDVVITRDATAPVINISNTLQLPPAVNNVIEQPYPMSGTVSDANFAGLTINGNEVSVLPGSATDLFDFSAALSLPVNTEQTVELLAWDFANNQTSQQLILNATPQVGIELITPLEGAEFVLPATAAQIEVVARLSNATEVTRVSAQVDQGAAVNLDLSGIVASNNVQVDLASNEHTLLIQAWDAADELLASTRSTFTTQDQSAIPLSLQRSEPFNGQRNLEPNISINLYFNRAVDPQLLQIDVRESVIGLTYPTGRSDNPDFFPSLENSVPVEVNRSQEEVPGEFGTLPGNTVAVFYPERDFAYGADLFITVSYDGDELERFTFKVREIPTFMQGSVYSVDAEPVKGLVISLPELGLETVSDNNGSYSVGFGLNAENALPGGRHLIVYNPGRHIAAFAEVHKWINLQEGRLNRIGGAVIPFVNPAIPFRPIASGQDNVILAGGELVLDLSNTRLDFPNGNTRGDVHVQFAASGEYAHPALLSVQPQWLFAVQPPNIKVSGDIGIRIEAPALRGSYSYLPDIPMYVVMVGLDPQSRQIVPVGVGLLENRIVTATVSELKQLDYLGYAIVQQDQSALQDYYEGNSTIQALIQALEFEQ